MLVNQYSYILNYIRRKVEGTKSQFDCLKLVCVATVGGQSSEGAGYSTTALL